MKSNLFKKVIAAASAVAMMAQMGIMLPVSAETTNYYSQDYESATDASAWKSNNASGSLALKTDKTNYIEFATGTANDRGAETTFTADVSAVDTYVIEYDAALTSGSQNETEFSVLGTGYTYVSKNQNYGTDSNAIVKMTAKNSTTWTINKSETATLTAGTWYHYKVIVDKTQKLASVTITDSSTGTAAIDKAIVGVEGSADIAGLYIKSGRYNAVTDVDNIVVRDKTDADEFGQKAEETLNEVGWKTVPSETISQPAEGESVDYPVTFTATGNYGGDLLDKVSVKWSVIGLANEDGYVKLTGMEDDSKAANVNVRNGVSNYYCVLKATITYGDVVKELSTPFAIIGASSVSANQLYPPAGYPTNMNEYSDELVGVNATSNGIDSKDPIFAGWSIYGSNGLRALTLEKEDNGDKCFKFASNGGPGSTVAVYGLAAQATQYVTDMKVKFTGDMTFGHYYKTPNNSDPEPLWEVSYKGGAVTAGTESISGVETNKWYRVVTSVDASVGEYSVAVYGEDGTLIGKTAKVTTNTVTNAQKYFCFQGTFPVYIKDMTITKPVLDKIVVNADPTTVKVPETGEADATADLSAVMTDAAGNEVTGVIAWGLEEEYANVELNSTGAQSAKLVVKEGASGTINVTATKDGKTTIQPIQLTTSANVVAFTKSTSSITIPFTGESDIVSDFTAETRDGNGAVIDGGAITYALLDKTGTTETTVKGVTFENGKMTVAAGASPSVVYVRATNAEGLSTKVKVNIHGLSFGFGSNDPEEGYTQVTSASQYTDKLGYGFETTANLTDDAADVKGSVDYKFKATVPNGNYKVDVVTTSATMTSETVDGIPSSTGISKSGASFNVAVCDGILDLTFLADSTVSTLTISQTATKVKTEKPAIYAIGDSTTSNSNGPSWGNVAGEFVPEEFASFSNNGMAGRDSVNFYNQGRVEAVLLAINPGDYVTVNMGINSKESGEGTSYPTLLENYYVQGIIQRGGIPVILTATPQGPVNAYEGNYNSSTGKFTCNRGDGARNDVLRSIAKKYKLNLLEIGEWGDEYFNSLTMEDVANTSLYGQEKTPTTVLELVQSWYLDHNHYTKPFTEVVAKHILGCLSEIANGSTDYIAKEDTKPTTAPTTAPTEAPTTAPTIVPTAAPIGVTLSYENGVATITSTTAQNVTVIHAAYKTDETLEKVETYDEALEANTPATITIAAQPGDKIMVWNSAKDMKPLTVAYVVAEVVAPTEAPTTEPTTEPTEAPTTEPTVLSTYNRANLVSESMLSFTDRELTENEVATTVSAIGSISGGINGATPGVYKETGGPATFIVTAPADGTYSLKFTCYGDATAGRHFDVQAGETVYEGSADIWQASTTITSAKTIYQGYMTDITLVQGENTIVLGTSEDGGWSPDLLYMNLCQ